MLKKLGTILSIAVKVVFMLLLCISYWYLVFKFIPEGASILTGAMWVVACGVSIVFYNGVKSIVLKAWR